MLRYREHDVGVTWFPRVSLSCKIAADGGGKEDSTPVVTSCIVMPAVTGRSHDRVLKKKRLLRRYFFTSSKKEKVGRRKSSDTVGVGHGPIISYDALQTPGRPLPRLASMLHKHARVLPFPLLQRASRISFHFTLDF
ncbi:hypothetical protein V1478_003526 [Vespula squamosa]|uniref:Uncharacterized protein n=2 Tax=Vespula TaxID=7451 RepID=A0ABD2BM27_VESSQ